MGEVNPAARKGRTPGKEGGSPRAPEPGGGATRRGLCTRVVALPAGAGRGIRGAFQPRGAAVRMLRNLKAFVRRTRRAISPQTPETALPPLEIGSSPGTTKNARARGGLEAASGVAGGARGRRGARRFGAALDPAHADV